MKASQDFTPQRSVSPSKNQYIHSGMKANPHNGDFMQTKYMGTPRNNSHLIEESHNDFMSNQRPLPPNYFPIDPVASNAVG